MENAFFIGGSLASLPLSWASKFAILVDQIMNASIPPGTNNSFFTSSFMKRNNGASADLTPRQKYDLLAGSPANTGFDKRIEDKLLGIVDSSKRRNGDINRAEVAREAAKVIFDDPEAQRLSPADTEKLLTQLGCNELRTKVKALGIKVKPIKAGSRKTKIMLSPQEKDEIPKILIDYKGKSIAFDEAMDLLSSMAGFKLASIAKLNPDMLDMVKIFGLIYELRDPNFIKNNDSEFQKLDIDDELKTVILAAALSEYQKDSVLGDVLRRPAAFASFIENLKNLS